MRHHVDRRPSLMICTDEAYFVYDITPRLSSNIYLRSMIPNTSAKYPFWYKTACLHAARTSRKYRYSWSGDGCTRGYICYTGFGLEANPHQPPPRITSSRKHNKSDTNNHQFYFNPAGKNTQYSRFQHTASAGNQNSS